jgi:mannose-6-phosphate isomerase-like protein (cupin superfamily)
VGASRAGGRLVVTGVGNTVHFVTSMYDYEVHSVELRRKRMIPLIMKIKARSLDDITIWSSRAGEEFIFIMRGTVRLYTEFYNPVELNAGESAYIDSEMEHAFVSIGTEDAEIVSICLSSQSTQVFSQPPGCMRRATLRIRSRRPNSTPCVTLPFGRVFRELGDDGDGGCGAVLTAAHGTEKHPPVTSGDDRPLG